MNDARKFFTQYHKAYADSPGHAHGQDLTQMMQLMAIRPGLQALDVATGTGHTAVAMARAGARVVGLDLTPAMLDDARVLAQNSGVTVEWMLGTAEALPFLDESFDLITCRRAAHHFENVPRFLSEARRVLMRSGLLGISDMTAPNPAIESLNLLERLRDPSHREAWTVDSWESALDQAGFSIRSLDQTIEPMTWSEWLRPVSPDSPAGQNAFALLKSSEVPHDLKRIPDQFYKHRVIIVAEKR